MKQIFPRVNAEWSVLNQRNSLAPRDEPPGACVPSDVPGGNKTGFLLTQLIGMQRRHWQSHRRPAEMTAASNVKPACVLESERSRCLFNHWLTWRELNYQLMPAGLQAAALPAVTQQLAALCLHHISYRPLLGSGWIA